TYGIQVGRSLCREVGLRIQEELESKFKKYKGSKCYQILADRFYIMLKKAPFDQVTEKAKILKKSLDLPYKVSVLRATDTYGNMQEIKIRVRMAIVSYSKETLELLIKENSDAEIFSMMDTSLNRELKKGMSKGGDVIMSWNPETH